MKMLLGTWLGLCLVTFNLALLASTFRASWQRIGVRVGASWILAIAVLVLALSLRR